MRRERVLRFAFGAFLIAATCATRYYIRSKTLFEFDSINFALGASRFDLGQVTPQIPGYILHILLGRLLYPLVGEINAAYVVLSIILSIGAVLLLWRAAAQLRGERVGTVAALLWMATPLFWFHGAVNAIYAEEAFFASLLLYLGISFLKSTTAQNTSIYCIMLFVAFSLAAAARPTDLMFFLPAIVYVVWKKKLPGRTLALASTAFVIVTSLWVWELVHESGGWMSYWTYLVQESNFKTQSIVFGNSLSSQLDTLGKVAFYLPLSIGAGAIAVAVILLFFFGRVRRFIRQYWSHSSALFVLLVGVPALLFYAFIFFMKAGYLLNVVPSAMLMVAVLLDQAAIWLAERQKKNAKTKDVLSRPLIIRNVLVGTGLLVLINVLWFFVPWPGTAQYIYDNEDTRNSFIHGAVHRYEHSQSAWLTLMNRALEYTNVSGVRAVDSLNDVTYNALLLNHANDTNTVILASWWYRWAYFLLPNAALYDLELDPYHPGALWVGRSSHWDRTSVRDSVIVFHSSNPVLLLLRQDRPDFNEVARQVHLERLNMPEYLDIYRIMDTTFELRWHDRVFICR